MSVDEISSDGSDDEISSDDSSDDEIPVKTDKDLSVVEHGLLFKHFFYLQSTPKQEQKSTGQLKKKLHYGKMLLHRE